MIYVRTWSQMLNNGRLLVSDFSKEHVRLITYIKKLHPNRESNRLLPTFYTNTYECITTAIVFSLAAGQPINT